MYHNYYIFSSYWHLIPLNSVLNGNLDNFARFRIKLDMFLTINIFIFGFIQSGTLPRLLFRLNTTLFSKNFKYLDTYIKVQKF